MELRDIRYLIDIYEHRSISHAARKIGIAQPALSIMLRKNEDMLGQKLFLRERGGVVPTAACELLVQRGRELIYAERNLVDDLKCMSGGPSGQVSVGFPGSIDEMMSLPLINLALKRYPDVRLLISESLSGFVKGWMHDRIIDIAILYEEMPGTEYWCSPLFTEELVVFFRSDIAGGIKDSPTDGSLPMVLPSARHGLRRTIDAALEKHGKRIDPVVEVDSNPTMKQLVLQHGYASVLPLRSIQDEVRRGQLVYRSLLPERVERTAFLISRGVNACTATSLVIRNMIAEFFQENGRAGIWEGVNLT